jgi:LemA protein
MFARGDAGRLITPLFIAIRKRKIAHRNRAYAPRVVQISVHYGDDILECSCVIDVKWSIGMSVFATILLVAVVIAAVYLVMIYNNLIQVKHNVSKAWANIDVLLKQRHDELPKLIETCKQYMKFEQDTLQKVIDARSRVFSARESQDMRALGSAEAGLRASVGSLFAVAEQYPDLKTNQTFTQLQARISGLENAISDRREFYNESVNINNVRIEQFPDVFVARVCNMKPAQLLEFDATEKTDVDVKELFK